MSLSSLRSPILYRALPAVAVGIAILGACAESRDGSPTPASVTLNPGTRAFAVVGDTQRFTATVRDASGNVLAGEGVTWSTTNSSIVGVNTSGLATAQALGSAQVRATAGGVVGSAFVSVGTTGAYGVDVRFLTAMTPSQQQAFTNAAGRWQTLITGDVPNVALTGPDSIPAGTCGSNAPSMNEVVDDVVIFATIESIDGPGSVLAQAGPCYLRVPGFLPIVGRMRFDIADVPGLEATGQLDEVILHEMGHVLGYGVLWRGDLLALVADTGTADPYFTGTQGRQAFDSIGPTYAGGNEVPVEATGGAGTANAHWRESVFNTELMTGFLDQGVANPLSVISVASLQDLGYIVNRAASDPFSCASFPCPGLRLGPTAPPIELRDDIAPGPIRLLDPQGRVVGVLWR